MRRQVVSVVAAFSRTVVFSEHSNILQDEAKANGYTRNLWVDMQQAEAVGTRQGARPITIVFPKVIDLINLAQVVLQDGASKMFNFKTEPLTHSSVVNTKPYQGVFAASLDAAATEHGFTSKWWIPPSKLDYFKLELSERQRPVKLHLNVKGDLCNVDQLLSPEQFDFRPISPMSGRFYSTGAHATELTEYNRSVGGKSGLMFTKNQLELFKLTLQPDRKGVLLPLGDLHSRFTLFSVEDVVDFEKILASLNRTTLPPEPRFLMSGSTLMQTPEMFASRVNKYVISGRDVQLNGWEVKKDAKPVVSSRFHNHQTYSVMDLVDPTQGFERAFRKPPTA